ncbi:MAG: hypothetical protein CML13_18750 [Puniceicoccaceae bacterium]|nr:hypothetical protein [Puniceicoccaceae bacterium]|tara:strand:+ start:8490 stop:9179 length:690 start_codon:yes stop_codon:yes gene_type:complete
MNIRAFFLCVGASALLLGSLFGQDAENINSQFSVLSWKRTIHDLYYESASGEEFKFFAPNGSPTQVYDYMGPAPLNFYKYKGVDEAGNPLRKVVASYSPKAGDQHLLLFIPDPKSRTEERYRLLPLDYSPESIAEGTYRFFNLASYPVYIRFGEETFKVDAGRSESIRSDPSVSDGLDVAMALQVSEEPNSAKVVYSAGWTLKSGRSALVFITNDRGIKGRIDVKRIYF